MKQQLFILSFAVFCAFPAFAEQQKIERVLTEEACIHLALNTNHDILIHKQNILFSEQRIKEAKVLYLPTIDLNFNVSRFSNDLPTIINSNSLPASIYLPSGNRDFAFSTRLSLWQNIYNGGKTSATNDLAKMHLTQSKSKADIKKNEIITEIKINFYSIIALKEKIKIYKNAIENKNSKNKEYLQDRLDIIQHQYEIQMLDFLGLLGLSLDTIIDLTGTMKTFKLNLNLQQCVLWSYQFRPEMKNTQYQESIDSISVNLLTMERYPTIMLGASYDWMGENLSNTEKDWYLSLNINLPLLNAASFSKIKQKKIKIRQATIERSRAEEKIKLEVRKAYTEYNFWYNKISKIPSAEKKSKNINNIEQKISEIETSYNYLKSLFELEKAIGKQVSNEDLKILNNYEK